MITTKEKASVGQLANDARADSANADGSKNEAAKEFRAIDFNYRVFVLQERGGDFFAGWESTPWETVKRTAKWDKSKGLEIKGADLNKSGYPELVAGFGGIRLVRVR
jgi:hypothetical protein